MALICMVMDLGEKEQDFPALSLKSGDELVIKLSGEPSDGLFHKAQDYFMSMTQQGAIMTILLGGTVSLSVLGLSSLADRVILAPGSVYKKPVGLSRSVLARLQELLFLRMEQSAKRQKALGLKEDVVKWSDETGDHDVWFMGHYGFSFSDAVNGVENKKSG